MFSPACFGASFRAILRRLVNLGEGVAGGVVHAGDDQGEIFGGSAAIVPRRERGGFQSLRLSSVPPMKTPVHSRRSFIKTGIAGIVAVGVAPQVISARLLGASAPSKKVTLGFIGMGAHGIGVNLKSFLQHHQYSHPCDAPQR
jgi:hypothetical protein